MNNKPFDLQKALAGEPVSTEDGRAAIYKYSMERKSSEIKGGAHIFEIVNPHGNWPLVFDDNGNHILGRAHCPTEKSLFMAPVKKTVWVNMYNSSITGKIEVGRTATYATEEDATDTAGVTGHDYLGTYPIEIEL